jgi:uncharacterized membrane protein YfcA
MEERGLPALSIRIAHGNLGEGSALDWTAIGFAVGIVLGAGVIAGITGFGFGLVSIPLLLMLFGPAEVVTINKVLTLSTSWIVIAHGRRQIRPRMIVTVLPWALIGVLSGVRLLKLASASSIKLMASVVVVLFALILLRGLPEREWKHPLLAPAAGLASGALSTSTGLSGPPMVLYFTLKNVEVAPFRVTIATYFVLLDLVGLPALVQGGLVTGKDFAVAAILVPVAFFGRIAGIRLAPRLSRAQFYRLTLGVLLVTGAVGIIDAAASHL